ncbi:MAG: VanW family protein [Cyanobacteriota bacterium]|nr:VanW family protein [Cyanobacteriota bacterium]
MNRRRQNDVTFHTNLTIKSPERTGAVDINENRYWNMQLAIDYIQGLIFQPGEIFSFWDQIPRPTLGNGFRSGPMLVRGQLKTDVGGGLCQISTTLFGAFLQANFEILEHYNHSIDAHGSDRFFTLGQDATVAYGYKDLMVRNSSTVPLQLHLQLDQNSMTMTANIWGTEPSSVKVRLTSEVIEQLPVSQPQGISGWRVKTQRWVTPVLDNNKNLAEKVNHQYISFYQPFVKSSPAEVPEVNDKQLATPTQIK